jgi:hypothetical protein
MHVGLWGVLQNAETFTVRKQPKIVPKDSCACPPCLRQANTYSIYAGLSKDSKQQEVMRVDEVSEAWNRCCCTPCHPFRLEVRQYIPMPGDGTNSDYAHLTDDFKKEYARYSYFDVQYLFCLFQASFFKLTYN